MFVMVGGYEFGWLLSKDMDEKRGFRWIIRCISSAVPMHPLVVCFTR